MLRLTKRLLYVLASICLVPGLLAGCMPGSYTRSDAAGSAQATDTITAMIQQTRYYPGLEAMIQKLYEEEGILIECQIIPDDQYLDIVKMKLNSGESADIIDYNLPDIYDRIDPAAYCADLSGEPWVEGLLYPSAIERDGAIYGFPFQSIQGVHGMIYNKDVFKALELEVPGSWEELLAVCAMIRGKGEGITPLYMPRDPWVPQIILSDNLSKALGEEGLRDFSAEVLAGQTKWTDQPVLAEVIDYALELYAKGYVNDNYLTATYEMAIDAVGRGTAAMHFNGDFFAASVLESYPEANIGMFNISMPTASEDVLSVNPSAIGFVAYRYSDNLDTVKRVFELWSTPAYANLYFENRPGFPAFEGVDGGPIPDYLQPLQEKYVAKDKTIPEFNANFGIAKNALENYLWLYFLQAPVKETDGAGVLEQFQQSYEEFMRENQQPNF